MQPEKNLILQRSRPWVTGGVVLLALVAFCSNALGELLIYRRGLIQDGQYWRIWSGHLVHYGWSHLVWDLAVFIPTGLWLEHLHARAARLLYLLAPLLISLTLLAFDPTLDRYAGLSGLAAGTLVALACFQLRQKNEPAWPWIAAVALLGLKVVIELAKGTPLLVSDFKGIRNVPLAHIVGGLTGAGCALLVPPKSHPKPPPENADDILLEA